MTTTISVPSATSVEKLRATVTTSADPTAGAVEWQLTTVGAQPTGSWVAGAWSGSYANGQATAVSPLVVAGLGATTGRYHVWVRFTPLGSSETPQRIAGVLVVGA